MLLDTALAIDPDNIAVALTNGLPLVTRNVADFAGLSDLLHVVEI